ncbi:BolA family transcriptional regulator [bacterium]|nr:BolA family transcriptional regulator [bacterium]
MTSLNDIRTILETAFSPTELDIIDESLHHRSHYHRVGNDPSHLKIRIVSEAFNGKSKVAQHQLVNRALKPAFEDGLHALALETHRLPSDIRS